MRIVLRVSRCGIRSGRKASLIVSVSRQVQTVNGGEVQKELETCEAYHSDERRGHAKVVQVDWHNKHADGEENEQAFEIQTLDRRGRLLAGCRPDC